MAIVNNRIPTEPNRMLITPEDGSAPFYATVTYADEPTDPGTKINKALFDQVQFFATQTEEVPVFTNFSSAHSGENANANDFTAVAADGNTVIAFSKNICAYSTDGGESWTESTLPSEIATDKVWSGALIADGVWLAWGGSGGILSSSDQGNSWTVSPLYRSYIGVGGVVYGNGVFVAAGDQGYGARSTDGMSWSSHKWFEGGDYTVSFGDGTFVAATDRISDYWFYSTDGNNWYESSAYPAVDGFTKLTFGNGHFVVFNNKGESFSTQISQNGNIWSDLATNVKWDGTASKNLIKFENDRFFIFQTIEKENTETQGCWISLDGLDWMWSEISNSPISFSDFAYSNGTYWFVGGTNSIYSSAASTRTELKSYQTQTNENEVVGDVIRFDYGTANATANGVTISLNFSPKLFFFMAGDGPIYFSIFPAAYACGGSGKSAFSTPINWAGDSIVLPEITKPIVYAAIGYGTKTGGNAE